MTAVGAPPRRGSGPQTRQLVVRLVAGVVAWAALYGLNEHLWTWLLSDLLGVHLTTRLGGAVHFLLYDVCKILLLIAGLMFAVGMLRTSLRPEKVRGYLAGRPLWLALFLAAVLGVVTPFCSCSSIPLFIAFVAAGILLGVTLTSLIASPMISEVAVILMGKDFGWAATTWYVIAGMVISMGAGAILSRFDLTRWVEDFVYSSPVAALTAADHRPTLRERVDAAVEETRDIFGRVWKWVIAGVAVGAAIHGWAPEAFFAEYAGADNPFGVLIATVAGIPRYANGAGVVPIAEALYAKGLPLGTVFAFIMATISLSIPEFILLKRVLRLPLLGIFFGTVSAGIVIVGYLFNAFA